MMTKRTLLLAAITCLAAAAGCSDDAPAIATAPAAPVAAPIPTPAAPSGSPTPMTAAPAPMMGAAGAPGTSMAPATPPTPAPMTPAPTPPAAPPAKPPAMMPPATPPAMMPPEMMPPVAVGPFTLSSPELMSGAQVPQKYRCEDNVGGPTGPSPAFMWQGAPAGTMSFALLMRDRTLNNFAHWTLFDIPANVMALPEGVPVGATTMPAGAKQVANAANLPGPGYYGPCGQNANQSNMYEFTLYALDVATLPNPGNNAAGVERAIADHDLGMTSIMVLSAPMN